MVSPNEATRWATREATAEAPRLAKWLARWFATRLAPSKAFRATPGEAQNPLSL